jgi:hypothetical protein
MKKPAIRQGIAGWKVAGGLATRRMKQLHVVGLLTM